MKRTTIGRRQSGAAITKIDPRRMRIANVTGRLVMTRQLPKRRVRLVGVATPKRPIPATARPARETRIGKIEFIYFAA
jgi:hypothetical protein